MHRSAIHSARSSGTLSEKYDVGEPPIDSGTTLLPEGIKSTFHIFRADCLSSSTSLIAVHLVLAVVWSKGLQHRVVFPLEHQQIVSFVITAVTTAIGTIYSALLVYVTQTLSTRRSLRMDQTLTAIHDSAAAWSGIGAAFVYLWLQTSVRGSLIGVLCALIYLSNILVLHITTPALFSVASFNASHQITIQTEGQVPDYIWTPGDPYHINFANYLARSSYYLPSALANTTHEGLHEGTLYDILQSNTGIGDVRVNATGFNVTCGYPAQMSTSPRPANTTVTEVVLDNGSSYTFESTRVIAPLTGGTFPLLLYSTIPIVDSSNSHPPLLNITPPMNNSISYVQILECHHTIVHQTVVLDAQFRTISKVEPDIRKSASTWSPYSGPTEAPQEPSNTTSGNYLIDLWPSWYRYTPPSIFPLIPTPEAETKFISVMDLCLIQLLNLHEYQSYNPNSTVSLHDLENALSTLAAAMFWTLTHLPPTFGALGYEQDPGDNGDIHYGLISAVPKAPYLLAGSATATAVFPQGRLSLNVIAIAAGLTASIGLCLFALPTLFIPRGAKDPIDGTGILQAIWLYRNHADLDARLPQIGHPTTRNLRKAGNVRVRLLGPRAGA
ncbi:hypothetical protein FB451DRAFT_1413538 [Mycena latifolia]|nr:hypothetical protein FB451DRAFT_1413538 [Mycena latifolia]